MPHRLISFESISDVDVEPRKSYPEPRERAPSSPNGQVRIDLWPSRIERDKAEEGGGITKGDESRLQGAKAVHFTEDTTGHRKTVLQMAVGDNDLSFEDVMMKEVKKSAKDSMSRPMTVIQLKNKAKEKAPSQAGVLSRLKERFARSASANASFMHEQCNYASIQEQCSYVDPDPSDSEEEEEEEMEGREGGAVRGTLRHGRKIPRALLDSSGSGSQSFFTPVSSVQEDLKKLLVNRKLGTARRAYLSCPGTAEEYLTDSDSMADAIPEDKTPNQVELENAPTESLPLYQVADACLLTGLKKPGRTSRFTSRQRGCGSIPNMHVQVLHSSPGQVLLSVNPKPATQAPALQVTASGNPKPDTTPRYCPGACFGNLNPQITPRLQDCFGETETQLHPFLLPGYGGLGTLKPPTANARATKGSASVKTYTTILSPLYSLDTAFG
eukprot:gene18755-25286_t